MIFYTFTPKQCISREDFLNFPESFAGNEYSNLAKKSGYSEHNICIAVNSALKSLTENKPENTDAICDMLYKIFPTIFNDENSEFYGIFPHDYTDAPDDYFFPDFDYQSTILAPLLEIYLEFSKVLPSDIVEALKSVCLSLGFILAYKQSEYIDTHHIVIEILCLICIGELFRNSEIQNLGMYKLHTLLHFTLFNGALMEYNHPYKILISLEGIRYFKSYIKNTECILGIQELENIILKCFYTHFNPKLMQWTGPISLIKDSNFLSERMLEQIRNLTGQNNISNLKIPPEYLQYSPMNGDKFIQVLTTHGFTYPYYKLSMAASSYNTDAFSLGSFNHDDMFGRHRPCIGYFGTDTSPYCLYVRCLLNDYDFSSGAFHSIQEKGTLLGHISFSTNRGYKLLSLTQNEKYKTSDLRIRLQIDGDTSRLSYSKSDNSFNVLYNKLSILFRVHHAVFDDHEIKYQLNVFSDSLYFDIILYHGEEIELDFDKIKNAIVAFSLILKKDGSEQIPKINIDEDDNFLYSECILKNLSLKLETLKKPNPCEIVFTRDRQYINNTRIEAHIYKSSKLMHQYRFIADNIQQVSSIPMYSKKSTLFLKQINSLEGKSIDKISDSLSSLFNKLDDFSFDISKRYSVYILTKLFAVARKHDPRFEALINKHYFIAYDKISYSTTYSQIKKILSDTMSKIKTDYKNLQLSSKKSDNISKMIAIIDSEYSDPALSLQRISEILGLSESYISREFHKNLGMEYTNYLLRVRIEKAKKMIADGIEVTELPKKLGYYSFRTFNDAFRRYTGKTTKKYITELKS